MSTPRLPMAATMWRRALPALLLLALAGFTASMGYGWWHRATHATLEVQLVFNAKGGAAKRLRNGQLTFLDSEGRELARATIDTRRGVVWLAHPERGQCGPDLARDTYLDCFRAHSEWIPLWIGQARRANVMLEGCAIADAPVTLFTRRDNLLLWWVPLPQVGGRPYARHIATVRANQQWCGG